MRQVPAWLCAAALGACAAPSGGGDAPSGAAPQRAAGEAKLSLVGTRWRGVIDPAFDAAHAPWLEFVSETRLSGYTGCNLLSGAWRNEGGEVRVGPLAITKRACMGPEGEIERRLLAALSEQSRVTREGAKLVFSHPGGRRFEFYEAK